MKRFSNILLIVDEGTDCLAALNRAVTLATNNQCLLTVCTVVDAVPGDTKAAITAVTPPELRDIVVREKREWIDDAVKSVVAGGVPLETKLLMGRPFVEIIRQVLGNDHDLIIKCAETAGELKDALFVGSYGSKVDKSAVDILAPQLHVVKGHPEHVVPALARDLAVDLVVMGTVGRTGIAGFFMGNTAENILTQLDCSVLTIKPKGFISPVTLDS